MKNREIEDGFGCAGLVPSPREKAEERDRERLRRQLGDANNRLRDLRRVAEGIAAWMLHRFGPDTPEGREASTLLKACEQSSKGGENG